MQPQGKVVKVQPIHQARSEASSTVMGEDRRLFATVAFYFPQYRLQDVEEMPYRDVLLLIKTAYRIEAEKMYNLTMIASAPQSKNGKGVKTLMKHFKDIIDSNG
jgi:hypothetical protein